MEDSDEDPRRTPNFDDEALRKTMSAQSKSASGRNIASKMFSGALSLTKHLSSKSPRVSRKGTGTPNLLSGPDHDIDDSLYIDDLEHDYDVENDFIRRCDDNIAKFDDKRNTYKEKLDIAERLMDPIKNEKYKKKIHEYEKKIKGQIDAKKKEILKLQRQSSSSELQEALHHELAKRAHSAANTLATASTSTSTASTNSNAFRRSVSTPIHVKNRDKISTTSLNNAKGSLKKGATMEQSELSQPTKAQVLKAQVTKDLSSALKSVKTVKPVKPTSLAQTPSLDSTSSSSSSSKLAKDMIVRKTIGIWKKEALNPTAKQQQQRLQNDQHQHDQQLHDDSSHGCRKVDPEIVQALADLRFICDGLMDALEKSHQEREQQAIIIADLQAEIRGPLQRTMELDKKVHTLTDNFTKHFTAHWKDLNAKNELAKFHDYCDLSFAKIAATESVVQEKEQSLIKKDEEVHKVVTKAVLAMEEFSRSRSFLEILRTERVYDSLVMMLTTQGSRNTDDDVLDCNVDTPDSRDTNNNTEGTTKLTSKLRELCCALETKFSKEQLAAIYAATIGVVLVIFFLFVVQTCSWLVSLIWS
eukprot:m.171418 g.171418  ORF g.171418 m.171418 type:complete len:585 (-) comp31649_c0_seq1:375-2129(-)